MIKKIGARAAFALLVIFSLGPVAAAANYTSTPQLEVSCAADNASPATGDPVAWTVTSATADLSNGYTIQWDGGIAGTSATYVKTYATKGKKVMSAVVKKTGAIGTAAHATARCSITIKDKGAAIPDSDVISSVTCSADQASVTTSDQVTWTAVPVPADGSYGAAGVGSYSYRWIGDDGLSGSGADTSIPGSVSIKYKNAGKKSARVLVSQKISPTVTRTKNAICSPKVTVKKPVSDAAAPLFAASVFDAMRSFWHSVTGRKPN